MQEDHKQFIKNTTLLHVKLILKTQLKFESEIRNVFTE